MKLYDYYRSSASYRIRIALNFKGIECELEQVSLINNGGEQHNDSFKKMNSQELVPLLEDGDLQLNQSMAILEYLEEKYPQRPLLPADRQERAAIRAFCQEIACEIHPLNNLRVLKYIKGPLAQNDVAKMEWYFHWLKLGFTSLEKKMDTKGRFCFEDKPSWADLLLIPQIYNALRFSYPMQDHAALLNIYNNCLSLDYFIKASPEERLKEIDAVK